MSINSFTVVFIIQAPHLYIMLLLVRANCHINSNIPLIQKDNRFFKAYIIPECREYSIPIEWELLARDFNTTGTLILNVLPEYEDEFVMKVNLKCSDQENYLLVYMGCYDYCQTAICEKNKADIKTPVLYSAKTKHQIRTL